MSSVVVLLCKPPNVVPNTKLLKMAGFVFAAYAALMEPQVANSGAGPGSFPTAEDLNSSPTVFEFELVAEKLPVDLTGNGLVANAYTFNGGTPGPELRLQVGDKVIAHFTNRLDEPMTVHWHGIELDNPNDGTTITQDPVMTGETFIYRFRVTRPGIFWYHSHSMPANKEFKGLFGPIIVTDNVDQELTELGILPSQTHTLMLSDTTVCKAPGKNDTLTFQADPATPWAFSDQYGPYAGHSAFPTPKDLCETPRDIHGNLLDSGPLSAGEIPNVVPPKNCGPQFDCRVNEGQLVLTNGRRAAPRAGSPFAPGAVEDDNDFVDVQAGQGLRLQILNASVARYFRLRLTDQHGQKIPLLRVGGEGGLLNKVRLEGGVQQGLDFKFDKGEILLANATRKDVVLKIPENAKIGDVLTLWTLDFQHYGTQEYPNRYGNLPTVPVVHFRIVENAKSDVFTITAEDPLRVHPAINDPVEDIRSEEIKDHLLDPRNFDEPQLGIAEETLSLAIVGMRESIDGIHGIQLEGTEADDFRAVPHVYSSRWARLGDLLELRLHNRTQMHHPMHLHGFSFQPIRLIERIDSEETVVFEYPPEFVDTVDIPPNHILVMRVRLEDRPYTETGEPGGGTGRWLFHCHIFNHASLGMVTELVVLEPE